MSTEFLMPKLGLTMEEGTITAWLVEDGAFIEAGTPVLRIETDKVESDVESPHAGRLQQTAKVGDTIACGRTIGLVLGADDEPADVRTADPTRRVFVSPNAYRIAATLGVDPRRIPGTGPDGRVTSEDVEDHVARNGGTTTPQVLPRSPSLSATPAAHHLADLLGIDIASVAAHTGSERISRDDVARHVRALLARSVTDTSRERPAPPSTAADLQPPVARSLTGMRGTIARRMHASLHEMAQLTLTMEAPSDALLEHRHHQRKSEVVPGITDYVLAATSRALRRHPIVNAQITESGIVRSTNVHLGLAVALDEGLLVPVIKNADSLSLTQISETSRRLAQGARNGSLTLEDLDGGTMSVTALGMFGVDAFTPIINPPNAAILGVGRIRPVAIPAKKKGKKNSVEFQQSMTLSLTWDHRVFDGAPAAEFCRTIVELLQDPAALTEPG